jgi:acyl-CoA dehydrogenase
MIRFSYLADLAMFSIGGRLKARGNLSGRYADVLGWLIVGFSTLRRFEAEGRREEDLPLVHCALQWSLFEVQKAFEGIYQNLDGFAGRVLRFFALPWLSLNPLSRSPDDRMTQAAAHIMQRHDAQWRRLHDGVFLPPEKKPGAGRLLKAFRLAYVADPAIARIVAAQQAGLLPKAPPETLLDDAERTHVLSPTQRHYIEEAREARMAAIEVDVFPPARNSFAATKGSTQPRLRYRVSSR